MVGVDGLLERLMRGAAPALPPPCQRFSALESHDFANQLQQQGLFMGNRRRLGALIRTTQIA